MTLPQVLIVGDFAFPHGSAAANNLRGHCVAFQAAGYTVGVLPKISHKDEANPIKKTFRGVSYWHMSRPRHPSRLWRLVQEYLNADEPRLKWLEETGLSGVKAIFAYTGIAGSSAFLYRLSNLCSKRGVKLYCYVVEWFEWRDFNGKLAWLNIMDVELLRRVMVLRTDGAITITNYLQRYYYLKGLKCLLLPPLMDALEPICQVEIASRSMPRKHSVRLLFSGSYNRDRHDVILKAVLKVRSQGSNVIMEYLGCGRDQIQRIPGVSAELINALGEGVHFYGRVDDQSVAHIIRSATFGIILRDNRPWAQACFPSKVPEFFAFGVPMLCNISSDLAGYLRDGENSLVCHAVTVDDLCATLRRAWELTESQLHSMKLTARQTAESFDARSFASVYRALIG